MPRPKKDLEVSMLRKEIEILIAERQSLLRIAGAAGVFIAGLDSNALPKNTYAAAEMLSKCLNEIPEETLGDALKLVRANPSAKTAKNR